MSSDRQLRALRPGRYRTVCTCYPRATRALLAHDPRNTGAQLTEVAARCTVDVDFVFMADFVVFDFPLVRLCASAATAGFYVGYGFLAKGRFRAGIIMHSVNRIKSVNPPGENRRHTVHGTNKTIRRHEGWGIQSHMLPVMYTENPGKCIFDPTSRCSGRGHTAPPSFPFRGYNNAN